MHMMPGFFAHIASITANAQSKLMSYIVRIHDALSIPRPTHAILLQSLLGNQATLKKCFLGEVTSSQLLLLTIISSVPQLLAPRRSYAYGRIFYEYITDRYI
jgi:hypothetical protein